MALTALPNSLVNSSSAVWMAAEWQDRWIQPFGSFVNSVFTAFRFQTAMTGDNFHESTVLFHQLLYILPQGYWFLLEQKAACSCDPCWFPNDVTFNFGTCTVLAVGFPPSRTLQEGLFLFCWQSKCGKIWILQQTHRRFLYRWTACSDAQTIPLSNDLDMTISCAAGGY